MRKLLSKQHQRQIEIIEYLKQQNDNIPISKIACAIGCSTRIIHEDFQKFKDLEKVFLISSNNAGVKLEFKKDASMEAIYYYFISESLAFRLLKVLFFQNFTNREDLCSKLFISRSALGMLIEQINLVLKENYHITIDKQQLNFTGSEKQIRLFFLRLFYDSSPKETWDFGDYCVRKTIFNYINQFYLYLTGYEDQIESFQLTTLSLINWIRYQQGYSISPTEFDSHRHIIDFLISMDNKSIQQDFSEIFHLDFSEESLLQVFFPFISDKLVYSNISNVINNNFVFTNSYIFLQKEIPHLADKLSIHLYNQQLLISKIHNGTFLFPFNVTHNSNLLESKKFRFITKQESYLPLDTKSIISFLESYLYYIDKAQDELLLDHLMFIILSVWEDLLFQASLKISISIGVISTLGYFHSKMLADYLKLFFNSNQIKIRDVKNRSDLAGNFNIVISNCSIPENALNGAGQKLAQKTSTSDISSLIVEDKASHLCLSSF